eukprot:gnl/MRDRNA2_/MRDRNA2_18390_c0_seq1.p1 gnl/MRDRNA2_/MRDRNA2_18390_c0~~gnl/MRDRNA2_/MRDRNA2_18390_c0_seq1.p1  ORF type:complete len:301 (-),score=51.31 gnl/MRDRNA2_/MRDRNA2_18390_c0_seq1:178-1080(-)
MPSHAEGFDVTGAVVVVTGGGSGIGRQICIEAAKRGAKAVVAVDFNLGAAKETVEKLKDKCEQSLALYADCGNETDMYALITKVEREIGSIGLFVANAGIAGGSPGIAATDKEWMTMGGVNTMQHIYWARHLVPRMVQRGGGYVVITSSAAGLLYVPSLMYKVTKAAAIAIGEWIAITHGDDGIGVSVLCPQQVQTNLITTSHAYERGKVSDERESLGSEVMGSLSGAAAMDGVLQVDEVATLTLDCVKKGEFLILPHKEVQMYNQRKAGNTTKWIRAARSMARKFSKEAIAEAHQPSKL